MKGKHVKSENIINKIISMIVLVMMLTSNIVTPIRILADENAENIIVQNENQGTEEEENSEDENSHEDAVINTENMINTIDPNNQDNESVNEIGNDTILEDDANNNESNEEDNFIDEVPVNNAGAVRSLNKGPANNRAITLTPQELDNQMKATTKEDIEIKKREGTYKTSNDSYEIRRFETQFLNGASIDENGNFVWKSTTQTKGHEFTFRVNYELSGYGELPAGSLQITIPKKLLRDRNGNLNDKYSMSLPTLKECEQENEMAELIYKEDGDYLVIYNPIEVKAGLNGYFEISYATDTESYNYKDYDKTNTDLVLNGGTASDNFFAIIALNVEKSSENPEKETLNNVTDDKNVFIDTAVELQSTQKRYPTINRSWDETWMEEIPADANDYFYLVWEISSYISNPTQKYDFSINDFVTDLTDGTPEGDYEIVGYKLSGEKYYSNKNTVTNQLTDGYRYDYVLTRHKKSTYVGITYELKNTETATVHPVDGVDSDTTATSSNTFKWDPSFDPPVGHFNLFKYGNNNWYRRFIRFWDYANYDLDKLQNYEETGVNELKGFKYFTETIGYAYPWTLREGGSSNNYEDYGVNEVNYDTWDDTLYLEDDENPMNTEDYYLEYFTYSVQNNDAQFDEFHNQFTKKEVEYSDDEVITFYAKFGNRNEEGGNNWVEIGTYNLNTGALTPNTEYIDSMTSTKIVFKEGVHATAWRFTTSNKHYYTYITVTPYFVLTNSDYVKSQLVKENGEKKSSIKIENDVTTNITDYKGNLIFAKTDKAFDYARVTYYDSDITKDVASVSNKKVKKQYTITWKVKAYETATSGDGDAEYIFQDSGKFYDLVPAGGDIDANSIQIITDNGILPENEYSYEIISNYKGSARTMLVVKINAQAKYYYVYYTTVHSWESMKDFGRDVLNPVAYESGNEKITNGCPDDGGNLSLLNKALMYDLDETTDDKKFLYTESSYSINALTAAISGLHKKVKNVREGDYSYNTEVGPSETYSYRLRYENTFMNSAKDLILFDSIENFKVVDSEAGTEKTSGWHGTLKSVDLNQLTNKGIAAKVYISSLENLDLEANHNLSDTSVWQLVTDETDLSIAKAIAIDMTKDTNGNNFVLDTGDSVTATIYMESPDSVTEEVLENSYAYNNIYMQNTLIDELGQTIKYFIHQDYTTVKYRVVADVPIQKVNARDESEGIKGITFRLYGTSLYGNDINKNITTPDGGYCVFKDIEAGEYILQEYEGTPDWIEDHTEHHVKINIDKSVYIDDQLVTKQNPVIITNEPRIHTDVTLYKKDLVTKYKAVEGAKLKLSGTSDYGNEILLYGISDKLGKITFKDIEKGTYELEEISTAEGYTLNDQNKEIFRVIVDENGNYDIKSRAMVTETRYAHTSNFDDDGNRINGSYYFGTDVNRTVKLKGAKNLHVYLRYGSHTGWIAVYDGSVTPNYYNYGQSVSGRLTGYSNTSSYYYERTYEIEGDTVQFYFDINGATSGPYGYYAVVTGEVLSDDNYTSIYNNGRYEIYNEPLHNFSFTKKDLLDKNRIIEGATFKIIGTSDYGTYYEKTATSDGEGKVNFDGLEKGQYTLTEIATPDNYILNTNKYTVTIDELNNVTIIGNNMASTENGYEIYNEPKHDFYFVKKDKYNNAPLGGAQFRLYGTSNIGNIYDKTVTSVEGTGIVSFDNLESGTYILKEIKTPDTDETTYVPDEDEKLLEISADGTVTLKNEVIWPLSKTNENEPYTWYNTRNKGQITITKRWVDNLTNEERQEPKIYISTKRGELAYSKVYFRTADSNNSIIDYVTSENVTAFKRNIKLTEQEVLAKNPTRLDNNYNNNDAEYKIYAWEEDGTVYWWTKADRAVLPANLDYYFQNEASLKEIKWSTIYRKGYWSGTPGSETIETSVTNMQNMFYGCTSMENLDISIINNSGITEETKANMQYVFGNNGETPEGEMSSLTYITIGDNFKLYDTSVLPDARWKNQETQNMKKNIDLIGDIPAGTYEKVDPVELIGQTVYYATSLNGVPLDNWRIFDIEDGYVYLIYAESMHGSAIEGKIPGVTVVDNYYIKTNSRKKLIEAMTTESNWNDLLKGTIKGTYIDYTESTDEKIYANGGPTLELYIDSWNKIYPNNKLYTAYKENMPDGYTGNYIGKTENPTDSYVYFSGSSGRLDSLYFPGVSRYPYTGYWLATPSAYKMGIFNREDFVVFVGDKKIGAGYYANPQGISFLGGWSAQAYAAFRPIICLPADILDL